MERSSVMPPESVEFSDGRLRVWVSSVALATLLSTAGRAGRCETGGILIGRYDADGWTAEVVEATSRPRGSRSGWWWFKRGNAGLAELLEARWGDGVHYLGEWHFHPGAAPTPSATDRRSMRRIATDPAYQCHQPILIILGGKVDATWELSVTVFDGEVVFPLSGYKVAPFSAEG